jgi:hypothetical protein
VLHAHLVDPPPSVTRARPELPHAFDGVIATALAKDPAERFHSCGDLVHAARNAASGRARRVENARPPAPTIASAETPARQDPVESGSEVEAAIPEPAARPSEKSSPGFALTPLKLVLLMSLLVLIAASASGAVVYFLTRNDQQATPAVAAQKPAIHPLSALVPAPVWETCKTVARHPGAVESAVCLPPKDATTFSPDRLELSTFASGAAVQRAYEAERRRHGVKRDFGRCNGLSWGGEGTWLHNPSAPGAPPKPGGSRFCYFQGNNVVIVWTHRKFSQSTHTDLLGIAVEGGSDHPGLYGWWRFWHHRIGKVLA